MRKYYNNWKRIFLAPDDGTGGGGGSANANPPGQQQQQQQQAGSSATFVDPTASLDLDDLEPEVRKIVEESRKGFASLQKQAADTEAARQLEEQRRKDFQSNFDKLQAQVKQLTGGQGGNTGADPRKQQLDKMTEILVKRGVSTTNAPIQAELMLEMMTEFGQTLKAEIGADLRPFASSIVSREAEFAWSAIQQSDKTGAINIPEIAQIVWTQVQTMADQGQQVTPAVVQNLLGMAYFAHLQNGGAPAGQQQQQQQQPPRMQQQTNLPNVGRLTYPGAGNAASRPAVNDPNAARTALDPDTDAALQTVLGTWAKGPNGIKAPGYREPAKKGGR